MVAAILAGGLLVGCVGNSRDGRNGSETREDSVNLMGNAEATSREQVVLFDVPIHRDEISAIKELSQASVLKCYTINESNGEFRSAVVEFAGVKFGLNKGFRFITSRYDKQAIDSIVAKISSYYGAPDIDGSDGAEYYHWDRLDTVPEIPRITVRPLHSDEGGTVMFWNLP